MPSSFLPPEIWRAILDYAVPLDDEPLLEPLLIGPLAESSWYEMVFGEFWLRRPLEAIRVRQRENYAFKKVRSAFIAFISDPSMIICVERHAHEHDVVTSRDRVHVSDYLYQRP